MELHKHNIPHYPVMLDEVMSYLGVDKDKRYLDCTFGCGGYSKAFLSAGAKVCAIDRDVNALHYANSLKEQFTDRFEFRISCFADIANDNFDEQYDGIVFDLGVSSVQLDSPDRGFSFRFDGPLDMRMGNSKITASDIVNSYEEEKIANILYQYGEERKSRSIAKAIVLARKEKKISTTLELANIIRQVIPRARDGIDPATRSFQALRICVNDELGQLNKALMDSIALLRRKGRIVVVSFHSLEDRAVKRFMQGHSSDVMGSRYIPAKECSPNVLKMITKKPVMPCVQEIKENKRSRSAKLRCAELKEI